MEDGFLWGEAEVTYPDWVGTAQLDKRMTGPSLNDLVGLNHDDWFIIGLDIGGGEHSHALRVIAIPQGAETAEEEVVATEFLIHNKDPYEILQAMTHVFELRLRVSRFADRPIRIMSLSDVPEKFMQE
ncbi:hypothetical protein [Modestobacter altitudinis]|uniref:hypothetical protein n=1 Tax=Modestobacter altitudinis TaxID=2213158 RepID=UPI00110CDD4E|nr:hypothetical protein [Modestobacter altitudinis]